MRTEEYQFPISRQGGWESINGNSDVYIFQGYDSNYCLLAYSYDKESGRGSFSCYRIDSDENGCYIGVGTKRYYLLKEQSPYGLRTGDWGSYMQN